MKSIVARIAAMLVVWGVAGGLAYFYNYLGFFSKQSELGLTAIMVIVFVAIYAIHVVSKIWAPEWPSN